MFVCIFTASAFAGSQSPTTPQQPAPKDASIILRKRTDNKVSRMPSNNPENVIGGVYNEDGILYLYPSIDTEWELVISSPATSAPFQASTAELISGIYIGELSTFTIELSSSTGTIFVGTVYLE